MFLYNIIKWYLNKVFLLSIISSSIIPLEYKNGLGSAETVVFLLNFLLNDQLTGSKLAFAVLDVIKIHTAFRERKRYLLNA
jgi:hypothetical protein